MYKIELNGKDGIIRVLHPDGYRWEVQRDGIQMVGEDYGSHIEIDPNDREIRIYDSGGAQVVALDGRAEVGMSSLFGTDSDKTFTKKSTTSFGYYGSSTGPTAATYTADLTSALYTTSAGRVAVKCTLIAYGSYTSTDSTQFDIDWYKEFDSGNVPIQPYTATGNNMWYWNNTIRASILLNTYSDSACTSLASSIQLGFISGDGKGWVSTSVNTTRTVSAGYHKLVIQNSVEICTGGSYVQAQVNNLSAGFTATYYTSRVFGNGLSFGSSSKNVLAAVRNSSGNMEVRAMTNDGAHGVDIDPSKGVLLTRNGIQGRIYPTVMFLNVSWTAKDTYSIISSWAYDGTSPTITRIDGTGEGLMKVACNPIKTLEMTFSNCLFHVNTYGSSRGGIHGHVSNVFYSTGYLLVECSDDTTDNYCSFQLEVRYMGTN